MPDKEKGHIWAQRTSPSSFLKAFLWQTSTLAICLVLLSPNLAVDSWSLKWFDTHKKEGKAVLKIQTTLLGKHRESQTRWIQKDPHQYTSQLKYQRLKQGENLKSSKRKAVSYLQVSSHKTVSWFLNRNVADWRD